MRKKIIGYSFSDEETRYAIKKVYNNTGYLLDPHGAVGYLAMEDFQEKIPDTTGIILATAHPSKFLDVIEPVIGNKVEVPERLERLRDLKKEAIELSVDYEGFKEYLMGL
jgi:threonine synthase